MADRVRPGRAQRVKVPLLALGAGGIRGNVSDLGMRAQHLKRADNVVMEPERAMSVRGGTRRLIDGAGLPDPPHSMMKFYSSGGNKLFVAAGTGIYLVDDALGYVAQSLPFTPADGRWMSHANLNGSLVVTQEGGSEKPIVYDGTAWLSSVLPTPTTVSLGQTPDAASLVDAGTHLYRIRNRYRNGSGPAGASTSISVTGGNRVDISGIPGNVAARSDYLGWTLERTKLGSSTLWYAVKDGTGATTTDLASDASLQGLIGAADGFHAAPPHLDGIVAFGKRIVGWAGTNLYISQGVADAEATGILNFRPTAVIPVLPDDGDNIVTCDLAGDTIVVVKGMSVHTIEGFDIDSYLLRTRYVGAGAAGTRAAKVIGDFVVFYSGGGRLNIANLGSWKVLPFGVSEVGHYLAEIDPGYDDEVYLENDGGRYLEVHYRAVGDTGPSQCLRWNVQRRTWDHQIGMPVAHALIPKRADDFSGARYVYADPVTTTTAATDPTTSPSFITFYDSRSTPPQAYVQSLANATGGQRWTPNGVLASQNSSASVSPTEAVCGDGSGGIIMAYTDARTGTRADVYAQRFDAAGTALWAVGGVPVCAAAGSGCAQPRMCSDGSGGAIIVWQDNRAGTGNLSVYAQRINDAGTVQWTPNGVLLCDAAAISASCALPNIISNGAGGAWVVWATNAALNQVRYQRVNAAGTAQGASNGDTIIGSTRYTLQSHPCISDGGGGLILLFEKGTVHHYAQRYTSAGAAAWTSGGVQVTSGASPYPAPNGTQLSALVGDGSGGAIIAWWDNGGSGSDVFIKVQRYSAAGAAQWAAGGVAVSTPTFNFVGSAIDGVQDGSGGAIFVWDSVLSTILAQRVNNSGVAQFALPGLTVATASATYPRACTDGANGAIVAWNQGTDAYAQRILADGTLGWSTGGVVVAAAAGDQKPSFGQTIFTDTPAGEQPPSAEPGYHVWSGYDGQLDQREADGSGGIPIPFTVRTHDMDDGEPEVWKLFEMVHVQTLGGEAELSVSIVLDGEQAAGGVAVSASGVGSTWANDDPDLDSSDVLLWDEGDWAGEGPDSAPGPMPPGTRGKKYAVVASANTTAGYTLGGFVVDYQREPQREMSR